MGLDDLGKRICIVGQSGSGKSTLANAISQTTGIEAVHLDQYRHRPGTQWQLRPNAEFEELHAAAIAADRWVMDGNYSQLLPARLARATGLILLDISTTQSFVRYVRRTLLSSRRIGGLGVRESLSWDMVKFILEKSAINRSRRMQLFADAQVPKIALTGTRAVQSFYQREGLQR